MTNREKAVITAYTGVCMLYGDEFQHFHKYVAELMGRPVFNYELANKAIWDEIKEKATPDFLKLCANEAVADTESKFEANDIIGLLRKLLMATQDNNIAHRKHIGVLVEDVLNFLIDAMVENLKKENQEEEND